MKRQVWIYEHSIVTLYRWLVFSVFPISDCHRQTRPRVQTAVCSAHNTLLHVYKHEDGVIKNSRLHYHLKKKKRMPTLTKLSVYKGANPMIHSLFLFFSFFFLFFKFIIMTHCNQSSSRCDQRCAARYDQWFMRYAFSKNREVHTAIMCL